MALSELETFDSAAQAKRNLRAAIEYQESSGIRQRSAANATCIQRS